MDSIEDKEWDIRAIEKSSLDLGNDQIADKILDCITKDEINLKELKELSSKGVPKILRSTVWKILLGITPVKQCDNDNRRKQLTEDYKNLLLKHYQESEEDISLHHQIHIDCLRTSINGFLHVFENVSIIEILNRVLYIWSKEHYDVNYFQGLNEIVAPLIFFYLCEYVDINSPSDLLDISPQNLANLEIDSYYSLKQILDWLMKEMIQPMELFMQG